MEILLHKQPQAALAALATSSSSYLFHGPEAIGKRAAALELTRRLNCLGDDSSTSPCSICQQLAAGNYPDLHLIEPQDKPSITIEQIRTLAGALSLQLYYASGVRVVLIDQADRLTVQAQNALLKLLEEPPPATIFVLVTNSPQNLLPTVRSRCKPVYFPLPSANLLIDLLVARLALPPSQAAELVTVAEGAPGIAFALAADPKAYALRLELVRSATTASALTPFERLTLASRLSPRPIEDLLRFAGLVQSTLIRQLRAAPESPKDQSETLASAHQLTTLARFRRHLAAHISNRAALEALLLEL